MGSLASSPSLTSQFRERSGFRLPHASVYVFGESPEQRSHVPSEWAEAQDASFVQISESDFEQSSFSAIGSIVRLRSQREIDVFLDDICAVGSPLYLDITGLSHHVWVPLVSRMFLRIVAGEDLPRFRVVYVEPRHYRKSKVPRPGDIFALSERSHGIRPLPGMVRLRRSSGDAEPLVALLGFEGWRFEAVLAELEPDAGTVIPVLGVPGFRAEYPFYTVEGNHLPLDKDDNWIRRRFATANDAFEVFDLLREVTDPSPVRIALVGTKPHALGAVLFASRYPGLGELVYDNPVRSEGRTDSGRRVQVYDVSDFAQLLQS